jgi:predicted secreted protein
MAAVKDNPKYVRWEKALNVLELRRKAYKAAKDAFPKQHPLVKHTKAKLKEAEAAYDRIVSEL